MNPLLETYLIKAENFLYQRGISFIRASIGGATLHQRFPEINLGVIVS